MLQRVVIFSKDNNGKTRDAVRKLVGEFSRRKIHAQIFQINSYSETLSDIRAESFSDLGSMSDLPDMVLSVGGDGTFLETMLRVKDLGIPVAGVNTGRMGFLANIPAEEISNSVDQLCTGQYEIAERTLLELSHPASLFEGVSATALNEITIQKATLSMITIHVYVNNTFLNTYWADGLIVSTATGSTAYNLSVGGPILSPDDQSIIISPISPHNLTIRPIVIPGDCKLKMVMEGRTTEYLATCDFRFRKVPIGEEIHILKAKSKLKTVMLSGRDFYSTLRNKLMWGADKRN
ncbi:MAG: NAD(+)/NADH kinase [Bacteroidales bacterium]